MTLIVGGGFHGKSTLLQVCRVCGWGGGICGVLPSAPGLVANMAAAAAAAAAGA